MLSFGRRRAEREAAGRLYEACLAASRNPVLYSSYGVSDTLQGRFEMVALILFPVLHRLTHEPGDDLRLARLVAERFVEDMDAAFREMGVSDPVMPKRMKTLYSSFAGRMTAYGAELDSDDGALAAAVARNVFPDDPPDHRADALARYLKAAVETLRAVELSELQEGRVRLPDPAANHREPAE